jgi:HEAT repeat protein
MFRNWLVLVPPLVLIVGCANTRVSSASHPPAQAEVYRQINALRLPENRQAGRAYLLKAGRDALPALLDSLRYVDAPLRDEIALLLADLEAREAVPVLIDVVGPQTPGVTSALRSLTGEDFGSDRAHWLGWWNLQQKPSDRELQRLLKRFARSDTQGKIDLLTKASASIDRTEIRSVLANAHERATHWASASTHSPEDLLAKQYGLKLLEAALHDDDPWVRRSATPLAFQIGSLARPVIRSVLTDTRAMVRSDAAKLAGELQDAQLAPALRSLLGDPEQQVVREGALALGRIGHEDAESSLRPLLAREELRPAPEVALLMLGRIEFARPIARFLQESDAAARTQALPALHLLAKHRFSSIPASSAKPPDFQKWLVAEGLAQPPDHTLTPTPEPWIRWLLNTWRAPDDERAVR